MCKLFRGVFFKPKSAKTAAAEAKAAAKAQEEFTGNDSERESLPEEDLEESSIGSSNSSDGQINSGDDADESDIEPVHAGVKRKRHEQRARRAKRLREEKERSSAPAIPAEYVAALAAATAAAAAAATAAAKKDKFKSTTEPWNIKKDAWEKIGADQLASRSTVPALFGRAPRDFSKHCHHFSGEEWKMQTTMFLPIYLRNELPDEDYTAFCDLVRTIGTYAL